MLAKFATKHTSPGSLVLRLAVGAVFIAHGGQKLFGWWGGPGLEGIMGFVGQLGFAPAAFWAWALALVEFGGGILLVLGLATQLVGALLAIDMAIALIKVHAVNGFFLDKGGFEFVLVLFAAGVYFTLSGAGRYSLDHPCKKVFHKKKSETPLPPPLQTPQNNP
jgi:putative oxidoreductase